MPESKEIEPAIANGLKVQKRQAQEIQDTLLESLGKAAGSTNKQFGKMILNQLGSSCHPNKELADVLLSVAVDITGIAPRDPIEGMLAAQMIATHYAAMRCFSRAAQASTYESFQVNISAANKLTRSFTTQTEALDRHHGKGQQKVTVEHVHVHSGGQAIVGNVAPTKPS